MGNEKMPAESEFIHFEDPDSDHLFVEKVWRCHFDQAHCHRLLDAVPIQRPNFEIIVCVPGVDDSNLKTTSAPGMNKVLQGGYGGYYTGRVLWSKEQRWGDLHFSHSSSSLGRGAAGAAFRKNHKLYVTIGGGTSRTIVHTDGARPYDGHDVVGHVSFIPAERQNQGWYKGGVMECLALEIPPEWITKCLDDREVSGIEFFASTNRFDPLIFHTMAALREETEIGGPAGRLFSETAATLIALHLVRHYSNFGPTFAAEWPREMAMANLQRTLEFMEENLGDDLSLHTLAGVANMPVSSLVRSFHRAIKVSPHKYLTLRRIERSKHLLKSSSLPIAEIAYRLGFSSQSHFSTVFRNWVGDSPARFRARFRHGKRSGI